LFEFLQIRSTACGDIAEFVGDRPGIIPNCKKGDVTVLLGSDTPCPGARIVFEAKDEEKYSLTKALTEIDQARKNHQAEVGVFVFSSKTAPQQLAPISRYGADIVVIWNAEDPLTDSFLWAALEFARLSCIRTKRSDDVSETGLDDIDALISHIEKRAKKLDEIRKYARTARQSAKSIHSAAGKIINRARIDRASLDRTVLKLRKKVLELRSTIYSQDG
jgi:hypothetical protein